MHNVGNPVFVAARATIAPERGPRPRWAPSDDSAARAPAPHPRSLSPRRAAPGSAGGPGTTWPVAFPRGDGGVELQGALACRLGWRVSWAGSHPGVRGGGPSAPRVPPDEQAPIADVRCLLLRCSELRARLGL